MIPKLIKLGVKTILKIICEKIIIKKIQIVNNNKSNRNIDELNIKAESIIFNKIDISNISINIKDIPLRFAFNNKRFLIDNCNAIVHIRLTIDNINKTLFNKKWNGLKTSIESFISMSYKSIEIKNKSIYFVSSDAFCKREIPYTLRYERNTISLVNNINQEKLFILNDKNITVNNLIFTQHDIELELSSKIIFN